MTEILTVTIEGPYFKDEESYLTNEGYPLGTTCWYYVVAAFGRIEFMCAKTEHEAWDKSIEYIQDRGNRNRMEWVEEKQKELELAELTVQKV